MVYTQFALPLKAATGIYQLNNYFIPRKHCKIQNRQVSWLVTFLPSFPSTLYYNQADSGQQG